LSESDARLPSSVLANEDLPTPCWPSITNLGLNRLTQSRKNVEIVTYFTAIALKATRHKQNAAYLGTYAYVRTEC
jgi:hypothetical protein